MKKYTYFLFILLCLLGCKYNEGVDVIAKDDKQENSPYDDYGTLYGDFSVSPTKKVRFSKGHLQYNATLNQWKFADNQYDLGNAGWQESFGWATSGYGKYYPWLGGDRYYDGYYTGKQNITATELDWGYNNRISNGGNISQLWYTPTYEELEYLLIKRDNWQNKCIFAEIDGIKGLVLLPDISIGVEKYDIKPNFRYDNKGWILGSEDIVSIAFYKWKQMENDGAVFLPALRGYSLQYWTSSCVQDASVAWGLKFNICNSYYFDNITGLTKIFRHISRAEHFLVRCVREVE